MACELLMAYSLSESGGFGMGEEEFDDTLMDEPLSGSNDSDNDGDNGRDKDSEVLRSESALPCDASSHYKRQCVEERLARRRLEQELQDYDFELA